MKLKLLLASVFTIMLCGCGGSSQSAKVHIPMPGADAGTQAPNPADLAMQPLHSTSGVPIGIRLRWNGVVDAADGGARIAGYHIYKSLNEISDDARGDDSLWVEFEGDPLVSQPILPGSEIVKDDLFPAIVGETWHYRLASVATDGDESALSTEVTVQIASFVVELLLTTAAGVGDPVQIQGKNFGIYNAGNDKVQIPGVVWENGTGFIPTLIDAAVTDWQPELISIEVPLGSTIGKIKVTVGGVSVDTPEDFENADPYISNIDRLDASFQDSFILSGNHFGTAYDPTHRVSYGGDDVMSDTNYISYSETAITFLPPNIQNYSQHEIKIKVDAIESNSAFSTLLNEPPEANLNSVPSTGVAPLTLRFSASGSSDPENDATPNNGIANYHWDFDGDGIFNEANNGELAARGNSRPQFTYTTSGVHNPEVRVFDAELAMDSATIAINVVPVAPTIFDDPAQPNPSADGLVDNFDSPEYVVSLFYGIQDGFAPLKVEIDASYVETVPGDPDASFGQNDATQVYETNQSPFAVANPNIQDTATVTHNNSGDYLVALRVTDVIGRSAVLVYPKTVKFAPPSNIAVIHDEEGDPSGPGPTVSDGILTALDDRGYWAEILESAGLNLGDLDGFDACIWVSRGAQGTDIAPFEWLGAADLTLIQQFEDSGRSVIIISPPASTSAGGMFADPNFTGDYQPFQQVRVINTGADQDLMPLDFTAAGPPDIKVIQYLGSFADTNRTALIAGSTSEIQWNAGGQFWPVGAIRPGPIDGNLYFAMISFPDVTGLDPATLGTEVLLDYIVSGTIASL